MAKTITERQAHYKNNVSIESSCVELWYLNVGGYRSYPVITPYIENATLSGCNLGGCNLGGWGRWVMLCRLVTDSLRYEGLGVILTLSNELGVTFLPLDTQGYSVKLGIVSLRNQQPSAVVGFCDDVKSVNQGVIDLERVSILLQKCLSGHSAPLRVAFSELRMLSDCRMSCAQMVTGP